MKDDATNTDQISSSSKSSEPYFVVPPGLRPNTFFVGMEKEYKTLETRLFDRRRREGTACVLLHGQAGGGKSHLARQYIFKNKDKFAGGIFWIPSRSREEMYHAFWDIRQKIITREAPELCEDPSNGNFVTTVKAWFEGRHEWLLVYDGILVDREEEATELADFVPDSKNSSIIYISRQKNLTSKQRLLRPLPIKVGPLKEDDATKLLFKVLGKKKPSEADQKRAREIVKAIGCLPLMIDAISHRLADTQEPLAKYKVSVFAYPTLEGTYTQILNELIVRGHREAWNLVHILCWFAQNIPVEMIHLGMRMLRANNVEIRSVEDFGQPDINTSFGILIRYALIERNEPESDKDSISSSRESLAEPIDMLRMHSVIQSFCCDSLNAQRKTATWLGYAVRLFSFAYQQAHIKIQQRAEQTGEPGRVSDYRYFLVHGKRLLDHTARYGKTSSLADLQSILRPVLAAIDKEICKMEPNSSQESLKKGFFQISIFDRTSSSSDSGPSAGGKARPSPRPTPPPLADESLFGFPLDKEPTDSPRSLGTPSPGGNHRLLQNTPRNRPLELDDNGYDSDREGLTSHPMRPNLSEATARPHSRSRDLPTASPKSGWQVVPPSRKPRNRRRPRRRDLGSFRPTPARTKVDRSNAFVAQPSRSEIQNQNKRDSSPAFKSLRDVQSGSPSPPIQDRIASFFQRRFSSTSPKASTSQQQTYAKVAAGSSRSRQSEHASVGDALEEAAISQRGRPRESLENRGSTALTSTGSPLASEFVPSSGHGVMPSADEPRRESYQSNIYTPVPMSSAVGQSSASVSRPGSSQQAVMWPQTTYQGQVPLDMNVAPLPIETNTAIYRPPYPDEPSPDVGSTPQTAFPVFAPQTRQYSPPLAYQQAIFPIPPGYTSQPMSRDHSHQSHSSAAATEPLHPNPQFSPYIAPITSLSSSVPMPAYPGNISSRERRADGRPVRKSPRTEYAIPAFPPTLPASISQPYSIPSSDTSPKQAAFFGGNRSSRASSTASHGASPFAPPAPAPVYTPVPGTTTTVTTTTSTQGPGIALPDSTTGAHPGMVVAFEPSPQLPLPQPPPPQQPVLPLPPSASSAFNPSAMPINTDPGPNGRLQFGAQASFSLEEARRRTLEAEEKVRLLTAKRLEEEESQRQRRESRAYPDVNLIPTVSDKSGLVEMIESEEERGSEVGLGVRGVGLGSTK